MAYSSLIFCNLYFFRSLPIVFKSAIKLNWLVRPRFHSLEFSFCVFVEWIVQKIGIKKVFRIGSCFPLHVIIFYIWDDLKSAGDFVETFSLASNKNVKLSYTNWDECISHGLHFFRERQKGLRRLALCVEIQTEHRKEEKRMHSMTAYHNLLL